MNHIQITSPETKSSLKADRKNRTIFYGLWTLANLISFFIAALLSVINIEYFNSFVVWLSKMIPVGSISKGNSGIYDFAVHYFFFQIILFILALYISPFKKSLFNVYLGNAIQLQKDRKGLVFIALMYFAFIFMFAFFDNESFSNPSSPMGHLKNHVINSRLYISIFYSALFMSLHAFICMYFGQPKKIVQK